MAAVKRVRIIKKVREASGVWRFVSLDRIGNRYVWNNRPGYYFVEWWEGKKRRRQMAGQTPSEAAEAQRRKRNELLAELLAQGKELPLPTEGTVTLLSDAIETFVQHVRVHSPDKPRTVGRYQIVLDHAARILASKKYVEAITRADIDDYKTRRSREVSEQHRKRPITPRTINFEVSVLRTFFWSVALATSAASAISLRKFLFPLHSRLTSPDFERGRKFCR